MEMSFWVVLENEAASGMPANRHGATMLIETPLHKLDMGALTLGLRPLGSFILGYYDEYEYEDLREDIEESERKVGDAAKPWNDPGPWYDPEEAMRTLQGLIQHIEGSPSSARELESTLNAFRRLSVELEAASRGKTRFHLGFDRSEGEGGYLIKEW